MSAWKEWCRLCAREGNHSDRSAEVNRRAAKYLSVQVQKEEDSLPGSVCKSCSDTLANFDTYAMQCEKVQYMFRTLLTTNKSLVDVNSLRVFKNDYLRCLAEDTYFPICEIKEEDNPIETVNVSQADVGSIKKIVQNWNDESSPSKSNSVKGETDSLLVKNELGFDYDDRDFDTGSEEDYLPLSIITEKESNREHKRRDTKGISKHSSKSKKKKKCKEKTKLNLFEELINETVNFKVENKSDEENVNNSTNEIQLATANSNSEVSTKIKRIKRDDSFLSYECYVCKKNLKNWHALCLHFRDIHDSRAKIRCCCGKLLASRVSIARHCATHGKSKSFDCSKCNKRFPRESELEAHMITHLPKEQHPFVCCKCARRFSSQQLLKHHEKKHIPVEERMIHLCEVCNSKFASKSSLLSHMRAVHQRLKPFVCDQCGRAFTTKGILEEHQVRHSDARPHVCNVCHKSFKTKQRLSIHLDTHNDTVYKCPHCPVLLNSRRTLRMHLFVHDEVSRYQCSYCEKAFKRAKDLKNHNNLHTGRRPYSCPWCSRTFANGSNCRAHKRRMHPHELVLSDAKVAMINKVSVPPDILPSDDKNAEPKVIFTTIKRKDTNPSANKIPNFTFPPDVTEKKEEIQNIPTISITLSATKFEISGPTKHENSSPIHLYESSLSPLNLNTSVVINKCDDLRTENNKLIGNSNAQNDFQNSSNNFNNASSSELTISSQHLENNYTVSDYKGIQVFTKATQLYSNYETDAQNNYSLTSNVITPPAFTDTNHYATHYPRDDNN